MKVDETKRRQDCEHKPNLMQKQQTISNNFTLNPNWQANKTKSSLSLNTSQQKLKHSQLFFWSFATKNSNSKPTSGREALKFGTKYHRASIHGHVEMLCEASRRDCNLPAREHMDLTPTLLAAQSGQLDALRVLVGRGGDPERVSSDGSSALHLAAARNHLNCVSFLVNFGVNMWSLDNDLHTAKDVAAIEQQFDVQDYLDRMMAKQSAINTKQVQKLKEKAKLAAEKRIKRMRKNQMKAIKQVERHEKLLAKLSNNRRLLKAAHSISDIKLVGRNEGATATATANTTTSELHGQKTMLMRQFNASLSSASYANSFSSSSSAASAAATQNNPNHHFRNQKARLKEHQSMNDLFNLGANKNRGAQIKKDLDESAYSSSFSSTSGYLSSSSARSLIKAVVRRGGATGSRQLLPATFEAAPTASPTTHQAIATQLDHSKQCSARPKYSDLVAIKQLELKSKQANEADEVKRKKSLNQVAPSNATASCTSGQSTVSSTRFKGIVGGVSRKVHLKRLLFQQQRNHQPPPKTDSNSEKPVISEMTNPIYEHSQHFKTKTTPAAVAVAAPKAGRQHQAEAAATSSSSGGRSRMMRANSEPNLMQTHRSDGRSREMMLDELECEMATIDLDENNEHSRRCKQQADQQQLASSIPPPPPPLPPMPSSCRPVDLHAQQHQCLLTKCLSQLRLQHEEAINQQQQVATNGEHQQHQQLHPSKPMWPSNSTVINPPSKQVQFDNSDELIRHQLSANEFPLRPSIIKQKQLSARCSSSDSAGNDQIQELQQRQQRSATALSVDSIGSVGSLVQRNSTSSSSTSSASTSTRGFHSSNLSAGPASSSVSSATTSSGCPIKELAQVGHRTVDENNNTASSSSKRANNLNEFLDKNGLPELSSILSREQIDLEALLLLDEDDLKSLNILLGPRRKLLNAIGQHKNTTDQQAKRPVEIGDAPRVTSAPMVVDTKF